MVKKKKEKISEFEELGLEQPEQAEVNEKEDLDAIRRYIG